MCFGDALREAWVPERAPGRRQCEAGGYGRERADVVEQGYTARVRHYCWLSPCAELY